MAESQDTQGLEDALDRGDSPASIQEIEVLLHPPQFLTKDIFYANVLTIKQKHVLCDRPASDERTFKKVLVYTFNEVDYIYSSVMPYRYLGLFTHEQRPVFQEYSLVYSTQANSNEHTESEDEEEHDNNEAVCCICQETYHNGTRSLTQEQFLKTKHLVGICGHVVCRQCWIGTSQMYNEDHELLPPSCPICRGNVDLVSVDREAYYIQRMDGDSDEAWAEINDENDGNREEIAETVYRGRGAPRQSDYYIVNGQRGLRRRQVAENRRGEVNDDGSVRM